MLASKHLISTLLGKTNREKSRLTKGRQHLVVNMHAPLFSPYFPFTGLAGMVVCIPCQHPRLQRLDRGGPASKNLFPTEHWTPGVLIKNQIHSSICRAKRHDNPVKYLWTLTRPAIFNHCAMAHRGATGTWGRSFMNRDDGNVSPPLAAWCSSSIVKKNLMLPWHFSALSVCCGMKKVEICCTRQTKSQNITHLFRIPKEKK